jgi:predicted transcriptional regulator
MIKMTFTLDREAARELDRAAERLSIAKSQVVREAIRLYGEQLGRLTDEERAEKLATFDRVVAGIPDRPRGEVEAERAEVGRARRSGGRRS